MIPPAVQRKFESACSDAGGLWDIKLRRLIALFEWFTWEGLADPHFVQELAAEDTYRERLSEMLVAYKLMRSGYELKSDSAGPDFWAYKGEQGFWVEVVTPRPTRIDPDYLAQTGATDEGMLEFPADQVLRRWTQAIDKKVAALLGPREGSPDGKRPGYLHKGIVKATQPYVIAVNGRNLRGKAGIGFNGSSGNPCAVEALFAVGPLHIRFDPIGNGFMRPSLGRSQRASIESPNGSPIPLTTFLDETYAQVSAVWALDIDEDEVLLDPAWPNLERNYFASAGVFNPLAVNPLAVGAFPTFEDWTCNISGDSYQLTHHNRIPFRPSR
ncbi:hypothetical protein J5837_10200 [Pseudoxanthomonas helianthi]|uniref:Uncharacterized protein n=1 Tax=Pseudoxanthomonas helianthi TaxID=1453541 RepID=A0A940X3T9_9GAMM|nr:hypothetical protein [Pseudoxanthomonas helianthi]MBP3984786.1 hypothetical protein [Pseudoxanthomonas helianthi]